MLSSPVLEVIRKLQEGFSELYHAAIFQALPFSYFLAIDKNAIFAVSVFNPVSLIFVDDGGVFVGNQVVTQNDDVTTVVANGGSVFFEQEQSAMGFAINELQPALKLIGRD